MGTRYGPIKARNGDSSAVEAECGRFYGHRTGQGCELDRCVAKGTIARVLRRGDRTAQREIERDGACPLRFRTSEQACKGQYVAQPGVCEIHPRRYDGRLRIV